MSFSTKLGLHIKVHESSYQATGTFALSTECFKTSTRLSVLLKRIYENLVRNKHGIVESP